MAGHVDRSVLQSYYQQPGQIYDDQKTEGAFETIAQAVDANYDYAAGLVSAGTLSRLGIINVKDYGASGSANTYTASIAAGSRNLVLTTSSHDFAQGQGISIPGAGAAGATLVTTVSSVNGATVQVATAASTAANAVTVSHDDTTALSAALSAASAQGGGLVVSPSDQTYILSAGSYISIPSHTLFDLQGSTIKKQTNGLSSYLCVMFEDVEFAGIVNGSIVGDKDTHDYSSGGTHEGGHGINIKGSCKYIFTEKLDVHGMTGDAVVTSNHWNLIQEVISADMEQGSFDTSGVKTANVNQIRTINPIALSNSLYASLGWFMLAGGSFGGKQQFQSEYYNIYFFNDANALVSFEERVLLYDEVPIPTGATKVSFSTPFTGAIPSGQTMITIRLTETPKFIFVRNCKLHDCRRQGVSVTSARHMYIENNDIYNIKGVDPQGGIDIEDGNELNQYIYINGNRIYKCEGYSIIAATGHHIFITGNELYGVKKYVGLATNSNVKRCTVYKNVLHNMTIQLDGEVTFSENAVYLGIVNAIGKVEFIDSIFNNSSFRNSTNVANYDIKVRGCKFFNNLLEKRLNGGIAYTLIPASKPVLFEDCHFEGGDINFFSLTTSTAEMGTILRNCYFKDVPTTGLVGASIEDCVFDNSPFDVSQSTTVSGTKIIRIKGTLWKNSRLTVSAANCYVQLEGNIFEFATAITLGNDLIKILRAQRTRILNNEIYAEATTATNATILSINSAYVGKVEIGENLIVTGGACKGISTTASLSTEVFKVHDNILEKCVLDLRGTDVSTNNELIP